MIGSEAELGGRSLAQLLWLLNSGLPVKVLVLSELGLGLDEHDAPGVAPPLQDPARELGLVALAQQRAYVAQTAIALPDHFQESLHGALAYNGPALIRVHAPSPQEHGYDSARTVAQSRLAAVSRAFPLFRYDPAAEGVFGSRLTLAGNPDPEQPWAHDSAGVQLTPVDWAVTERRFAALFRPREVSHEGIPVAQWLALEPAAAARQVAVVEHDGEALEVAPLLLRRCAERAAVWRTLQELAGVVTPFTARIEAAAEARVADERSAERAALEADHQAELDRVEERLQAQIAGQIRERLLGLAGYR